MATDPTAGANEAIQGRRDVTAAEGPKGPESDLGEQIPTKGFSMPEQATANPTEAMSPMELASSQHATTLHQVTPETLQNGFHELSGKINDLKKSITPQRLQELTPGEHSIISAKLGRFQESVKGLSNQVGVEYKLPQYKSGFSKDAKVFIGWLTNGEKQLKDASAEVMKGKDSMSPANMLRVQAKMTAANISITWVSAAVSKGLEGMQKLMQTQL